MIARVTGRDTGGLRDDCESRLRPWSQLARSRRTAERARGPLPGRPERNPFQRGANRGRSGKDAARRRSAGAGYHYPSWALRWPVTWLRFLAHYLLMRPAILLLGWPRIEGRENLRGVKGPLLVISNHVGDVDPGFILTALPARFRHRLATATGGEALEALRTAGPGPRIVRPRFMTACSGRWESRC